MRGRVGARVAVSADQPWAGEPALQPAGLALQRLGDVLPQDHAGGQRDGDRDRGHQREDPLGDEEAAVGEERQPAVDRQARQERHDGGHGDDERRHLALVGGAGQPVERRAGDHGVPLPRLDVVASGDPLADRVILCEPLDYTAFVGAMSRATLIMSDSGGVQEEAPALGKPVLVLREMEYVQAAQAAGAGHGRILFRHILPNAMAPLIVQLSFLFAYAVLTEATLSFLGLGAVPPTPTWGNIMAEGRQYLVEAPWIISIPGVALMLTVLGLNLLGDGLRDVLDPRLRIQP